MSTTNSSRICTGKQHKKRTHYMTGNDSIRNRDSKRSRTRRKRSTMDIEISGSKTMAKNRMTPCTGDATYDRKSQQQQLYRRHGVHHRSNLFWFSFYSVVIYTVTVVSMLVQPSTGRSSSSTSSSSSSHRHRQIQMMTQTQRQTQKQTQQSSILGEFYNATNGDGWIIKTNWMTEIKDDEDVCDWFGVSCEDGDGQVTRIELVGNQLSGTIPPSFWKMPRLRHVNLRSNWIVGTSWREAENTSSSSSVDNVNITSANLDESTWAPIETIVLSENHIISLDGIGFAKNTLKNLNLNKNQISGDIPDDVFRLTNLEAFHVAFNHLSGILPSQVGRLSFLEEFVVIDNRLSGSLPSQLGLLEKCRVLGLSNNAWMGTIPTEFENLVSLREISIVNRDGLGTSTVPTHPGMKSNKYNSQSKGLTGDLITFGDMPFLSMLYLDGNALTGSIPVDFLRHNNRTASPIHVGLTYNNITGTLPQALERFEKLHINLAGNKITRIPQDLCNVGGWMGGLVEEFGCDAILCPPSTFNRQGRARDDSICSPCSKGNDSRMFFGATSCETLENTDTSEWRILAEFYSSMAGTKWTNRSGWKVFDDFSIDMDSSQDSGHWENVNVSACDGWYGIKCNDGKPTKLSLPANELFGTVPESIFLIPWQEIDLADNNIHMGSLSFMKTATQLKSLRLSNVKLSSFAGIEAAIGLEKLFLDGLNIKTEIPESLFSLTGLRVIDLQHGMLTGTIPTLIGQLSELQRFNVFDNNISGQLPSQLGALTQLHTVVVGSNSFSGSIPSTLGRIDNLILHAEDNQISFIPAQLCNKTGWMQGRVGELPLDSRCNAILCPPGSWNIYGKEISNRTCEPCNLNGTLYGQTHCGDGTSDISNKERLILDNLFAQTGGLYWTKNHSTWTDPSAPICSRAGIVCATTEANKNVLEIDLSGFGLRGVISSDIWELPSLRRLKFSNNAISMDFNGIEKASYLTTLKLTDCHLRRLEGIQNAGSELKELHLGSNQFDGTLPDELFGLAHVEHLWLNNNHFIGTVPPDVGKLAKLRQLSLEDNFLEGRLPMEFADLSTLKHLSLKSNAFSGVIPSEIHSMSSLQTFDISRQSGKGFFGSVPAFDKSPNLMLLDASYNSFSGVLPWNFLSSVNPKQTVQVSLTGNKIVGQVPDSWVWLESLQIDLADNKISALSDILCGQNGWQSGLVGLLDTCDAILCPPGTSTSFGRQTQPTEPCVECPGGIKGAPFFGTSECKNPKLVDEFNILTSFYHATNGTNWLQQMGWLSDSSVCSWFGVTCNTSGLVESIDLKDNLLVGDKNSGNDASRIFELSELKRLDLKGNDVRLDFLQIQPDTTKLDFLRLSGTKLSSLDGISRASQLKSFHATNNVIKSIPEELFRMTSLESLFLSFNEITGYISSEIGHLTNLKELYLFDNHFSGKLPSQIGLLGSLVEFVVSNNKISGEIPDFNGLPNLEQLSIYNQQGQEPLTGKIPSFEGSPNLIYFDASHNQLTGLLPDDFMANSVRLNETVAIFLRNNRINGALPRSLSKFQRLEIDLSGNEIGEIPAELCKIEGWMQGEVGSIQNCSAILCPKGSFNQIGRASTGDPCIPCADSRNVEFMGSTHCDSDSIERTILLDLFAETGGRFWINSSHWNTAAPICSWHGVTCTNGDDLQPKSVRDIDLSSNSLSGTLPTSIWTLSYLRSLKVDDNKNLVARLDGISSAAQSLESLSLSNIKLSSLKGIEAASKLKDLIAIGSSLTGTFPEEVFALPDIEEINLGRNSFFGKLPTSFGSMSNLQALNLFSNDFLSTIPSEFGRLTNLRSLVLSENLIYGEIPSELSLIPSLQGLAIHREFKSGPRLSGRLPAFDRVPNLLYLNLQGNAITGSMPNKFLSASTSIRYVGLSSNQLTGNVPHELTGIDGMSIELQDNFITGFPLTICNKTDWMYGAISSNGCDGFLCPPGYANDFGRSVNATHTCSKCFHGEQSTPFYGSQSCEMKSQREILTAVYRDFSGDQWYRNDFWLSKTDVCSWYGIACNRGRIVEINLGSNNLRGILNPDIFLLPELQILWLYSNPINVHFDGIGQSKKLYDLRLDSTHLQSLHGIGEAAALMVFDARYTQLHGYFPHEEISSLSNLRSLSLGNNKLEGSLPKTWSNLPLLVSLDLSSNHLSGPLPAFEDAAFLANIDLSNNALTGSIPSSFLSRLSPDRFSSLTSSTVVVQLQKNLLEGVIPQELGRFDHLSLHLSDNHLLGLPLTLCERSAWNGGDVENYGCEGILCSPGTSNQFGRMTNGIGCLECPQSVYYGSTLCDEKDGSSSTSLRSSMVLFALFQTVFLASSIIFNMF